MGFVSDLRHVLRERDFPRLFGVRLTGQFADGVFQASLASAVFFNPEQAGTASRTAAGFAILLLPYSLVGPFAGVLLDRWRRARVLVGANLVRAGLVVGVAGLLAVFGPSSLAYLFGALVAMSVNRFILAALGASLPHVVSGPELVMANAVSTTIGFAATLVGGVLGLLVRIGVPGGQNIRNAAVALVAAGCYAAAGLAARPFPARLLGPDNAPVSTIRQALAGVVGGFVAGVRHVNRHKPAAYALLAIGIHRFCYGLIAMGTLLLYRNTFQPVGPFATGLAGAAQAVVAGGIGALLAAVVTPEVTRRWQAQAWIATVFLLAGLGQLAFGMPFTPPMLVLGSLVLGFSAQSVKICTDTILQRSVDEEFRGRVFSLYDTIFNLTFVGAALVGAIALPSSGRSYAVIGGVTVIYFAVAVWYAAVSHVGPFGGRPAQVSSEA